MRCQQSRYSLLRTALSLMAGESCRKDTHLNASGIEDFACQGGNGGTGGRHVVDNKDMVPVQLFRFHKRERTSHIIISLRTRQSGL